MDDLSRDISIEEENITETLSALQKARERRPRTIIELSAIATFLHNTYNGM